MPFSVPTLRILLRSQLCSTTRASEHSNMTATKSNQAARSSSPTVDIEYHAASKKKPAQEVVEEDGEDSSLDAMIFKIRQASSKLYKENGRPATNADIAEMINESEEKVKNVRDQLKLARQGKRLNELRNSAIKAGFSRREDASQAELKGLDIEQSLLTPSDIQRLARAHPLSFEHGSYDVNENKMRLGLMHETLPIGSAREIIAGLEPFYREAITEAVWLTARKGTQRITPSIMKQVLGKYTGLTAFTSCTPPEGLVRFTKTEGVEVFNRKTNAKRKLMSVTPADKALWNKQSSDNDRSKKEFNKLMKEEAQRKSAKGGSSGSAFVADQAEEADTAAAEPKKKKSKSKSK